MEEVWKDIKGYEGLYKVSTYGRVKSLSRSGNGYKEKILKGYNTGKDRKYVCVKLYDKFGNKKNYKIHRLVAEAFLDNPNNLPQVNHIDGDTFNNNINNLEWCTNEENQKHAWKTGLQKVRQGIEKEVNSIRYLGIVKCEIPIVQFTKNYKLVKYFTSISKAIKENGNGVTSCLYYKTIYGNGYKWRFFKECNINNKIIIISGKSASGKNKVADYLKNELNFNQMISYTNRPMRKNEIEGYDYYFTDLNSIEKKSINGEILDIRHYKTNFGIWDYALPINELYKNKIFCILDLEGEKQLKNKLGSQNIISIYLDCDKNIRKSRAINRDIMDDKKIEEINRRLEDDEIKFPIDEIKKEYNYILKNESLSDFDNIKNILNEINKNYKKETEIVPIKYMKREFKYKGKYYCDMKELTDDLGLKYDKLIYFLKRKYGTVKIYNYPNIEEILDNIIINNKNKLIIEKENYYV